MLKIEQPITKIASRVYGDFAEKVAFKPKVHLKQIYIDNFEAETAFFIWI